MLSVLYSTWLIRRLCKARYSRHTQRLSSVWLKDLDRQLVPAEQYASIVCCNGRQIYCLFCFARRFNPLLGWAHVWVKDDASPEPGEGSIRTTSDCWLRCT